MKTTRPLSSTRPSVPLGERRRVVITGIGAVTPLGLDASTTWSAILEGKSGVGPITQFDPKDCPTAIAAEVKGFDVTVPIAPLRPRPSEADAAPITQVANAKEARKVGRFCNFALAAGVEAYRDSGLDSVRTQVDPERFGINIGVGMGGLPEIQSVHNDYLAKGFGRITPFFIPQAITNMASGMLSILLDLRGPNLCNVSACASGAHAIGESLRVIERGDADIMIAGGSESVVCELGIGAFSSMRALSRRNDEPTLASRPFDQGRTGFVMGEGAGILILESLDHAVKRGAKIYGEVVGYGLSGDAYHMTLPSPEGEGGARAMKMSLQDAGISPNEVGYVNAHGTSTPSGDLEEVRAISRIFPEAKSHLHVSSTKSMTGHLLGAAGAVEAIFSVLAIRDSVIPPTINLDAIDPDCEKTGICFTPHRKVSKSINYALSNSFGFGGTNVSLIFKKWSGN